MSDLMNVKELAQYLKVKEWTVYEWLRNGKIPASRAVGQWRFKKDVIDKWLSQGLVNHNTEQTPFCLPPKMEENKPLEDLSQGLGQIALKKPTPTVSQVAPHRLFFERRQEERIHLKEGAMFIKIIVTFPQRQEFASQVIDISSSGLAFKLKGEKEDILPGTPLKNIIIFNDKYQRPISNSTVRYCRPISEEHLNDFRVGLKFDIDAFEHSVIRRKLLGSYKIRMPRYGGGLFSSLKWKISFVCGQKNIFSDKLVNFSKFGIAFEVDMQDDVNFRNGDVLVEFSLILEDELVYSDKATIVDLQETINNIIVRCALNGQIDLENVFSLARSKIESEDIKQFISTIEKAKAVEAIFKAEVADLRLFLEKTKEKLDVEEVTFNANEISVNKEHYQKIILDKISNSVNLKLKKFFINIWQIVKDFDKEKYNLHKRYFQEQLLHLFLLSPFNNRSFSKPLGYAGDYRMIDMIYDNPLEGNSIFAKLLNGYAIQEKACQAVRNRLSFLLNKCYVLFNQLEEKDIRIMSVGSGPVREVQELIKSNPDNPNINRLEFTLLDADKEAISYSQEKITSLLKDKAKKIKLNFVNKDVVQLTKEKDFVDKLGKFDLIYSAGLFDYFTLNVSKRLTETLYNFLNPKGNLIIGNFNHSINENKVYMDFILEWPLFYRSREEMLKFAEKLDKARKIYFESEDTGITNFLIIEK